MALLHIILTRRWRRQWAFLGILLQTLFLIIILTRQRRWRRWAILGILLRTLILIILTRRRRRWWASISRLQLTTHLLEGSEGRCCGRPVGDKGTGTDRGCKGSCWRMQWRHIVVEINIQFGRDGDGRCCCGIRRYNRYCCGI